MAPQAKAQVSAPPVHTLLNEAKEQVNRRPAEAEKLANTILTTYADSDDIEVLLHARAIRAQALDRLGDTNTALALAENGLELAKDKTVSPAIKAELQYAVGISHQSLGNLTRAFLAFQKAHDIWTELGNEANKTAMLISMAGLYVESGDFARAITQYEQVLPWVQEHSDIYTQSRVLNNLAYGLIKQKKNDRALTLLVDARRLAKLDKSPLVTAYANENTGQAYFQNGQLDEAETYLKTALRLAQELELGSLAASANLNLGWVEFQRQNFQNAINYANKARDIATDNQEKATIRDAHFLLARLERAQGHYAKAIDLYEMYIAYQDEVASDETSRRLSILEAEFQLSQKENEIELLQSNREIGELRLRQTRTFKNAAVLGATLLLGIIAILTYLLRSMSLANRRAAQKTLELLTTQRELEKASKVKSDILAITSH
jgi:tetratricopeptide (TPR) repeat protein